MGFCNGCDRTTPASERVTTCPQCSYAACDDCGVHGCTEYRRFCSGIGSCSCGSCMHQVGRHSDFANPSRWIMNPGIVYGPTTPLESVQVDGVIYHHNLARGTCFCQDSNFGRPYSTPSPRFPGKPADIMCYMGAKGGRPYRPPYACWACRKFVDAKESTDRKLKKCSRCKAAKYCSVKCQKDHWSTHKLSCIEP